MDACVSIWKHCVYKRSNDDQSNQSVSAVNEDDTKFLQFLENEHALDSYMLQLAKCGHWFCVVCDGVGVSMTKALEKNYGLSVEEILLSRRAELNINATDGQEKTLLHHAAEQGNVDAVRMLLAIARENGTDASLRVDVNKQDESGSTALISAVTGIEFTFIASQESDFTTNSQYSARVRDSRWLIIKELVTAGANINPVDDVVCNALHHAAAIGSADAVRILLAIKMDKDSYSLYVNTQNKHSGRTALIMAAKQGHEEVVRVLIASGVGSGVAVRAGDNLEQVIDKACWSDKEPIADKSFCQWSDKESVVHINARDSYGFTALSYAAQEGHANIFKLLLESGADVFTCDDFGDNDIRQNVMEFSLSHDQQQIIETVIDCGWNVNSQNYVGDGILQKIVKEYPLYSHCFDALEFMIARTIHSSLKATNASGQTLVHAILSNLKNNITSKNDIKCEDLQKFLYSHDIDLQARNLELKTALDYITCVECRQRAIRTIPALNAHDDNYGSAQCESCNSQIFEDLLNETSASKRTPTEFPLNILEYWYRDAIAQYWKNHFSGCARGDKRYDYIKCVRAHALNADPIARDKHGRTYLHLVVLFMLSSSNRIRELFNTMNWDIEAVVLEKKINIPDKCGRTILHYLAALGVVRDNFFYKVIELGDFTARDYYDRTPLHNAARRVLYAQDIDVYALLVERGADVYAIDSFGETPQQLRVLSKHFTQFFYVDNDELLRSCEKQMLLEWNMDSLNRESLLTCKTLKFSSIRVIRGFSENAAYFNLYKKSRYTILMSTHTEMFGALCSTHSSDKEVDIIFLKEVKALIDNLISAVQAVDPRLKGHVVEVGSAYEGTQADFPDEFDFGVVLTEFSKVCQVSSSPVCPTGYVLLKRKFKKTKTMCYYRSSQNHDSLDEFFDDNQFLKISNVRQKYEEVFKKVVRKSELWQINQFFELNMADDSELYSNDLTRVCVTFRLFVKAPVNGIHFFHPISVDIVPCIQCILPVTVNKASMKLKSDGCNFVFHQPQKVYPWISVSIPYARVSFARAESSVIHSCSAVVKAAFVVAKIFFESNLNHYNPKRKSTPKVVSYTLKTAVLHCMASAARDKTKRSSRWSTNYETVTETELRRFTKKLFYCLLLFHQQGYVLLYFLPGHSIPAWNDESFLRENDVQEHVFHASMKGMPPRYIDKRTREKLQREYTVPNRSKGLDLTITKYVQLTHAVYSSCYEEGESVRLFNIYYAANPLVEYFNPIQL